MKIKALIILLITVCILSAIPFTVSAVEDTESLSAEVTVSIIDGAPVLAAEKVTVTDTDGDGELTISDALYCAHEKKYEGGAEAGYSAVLSEYGISLIKLWGDDSGAFGYYLNNATPQSLLDTVNSGDRINAFIYQDTTFYSDAYSYFEMVSASITTSSSIVFTLYYQELDFETWETVTKPAVGAVITINGAATEYTVGEDGKVIVPFDQAGEYVISAYSDYNIVAPVCTVTVNANQFVVPGSDLPGSGLPIIPDSVYVGEVVVAKPEETSYGWIVALSLGVVLWVGIGVAFVVSKKKGNS